MVEVSILSLICGVGEGALVVPSVIAAVKLHRKINTAKLFADFLIIPSPGLIVMATVGGVVGDGYRPMSM